MHGWHGILVGCVLASSATAQDVVIYDEALRNGFVDYSAGDGTDFASTAEAHSGTFAVAFTSSPSTSLSFTNPAQSFAVTQFPVLRFWIHGGTAGGQTLKLFVCPDGSGIFCTAVSLNGFVAGGAIAPNEWREVTVPLTEPPLSLDGSVSRFDLLNQKMSAQPILYVDDVSLLAADDIDDPIFADGFEAP